MIGTSQVKRRLRDHGERAAHAHAAWLFLALSAAFAAATLLVLSQVASSPGHGGKLVALFPPHQGRDAAFGAALRAGASPVGHGFVPGSIEVASTDPRAAARLRDQGALLVLPALPANLLGSAGCGPILMGLRTSSGDA